MTSEYVTVVQGTKRHSLAYRRARTFLLSLLRGGTTDVGASGVQAGVTPLRSVDTTEGADEDRVVTPNESLEPALDELLRMARELHIIEGHTREAGSVSIALSSCETELRNSDAVAFLAECIVHKLNELTHAPGASAWAAGWSERTWSPRLGGTFD